MSRSNSGPALSAISIPDWGPFELVQVRRPRQTANRLLMGMVRVIGDLAVPGSLLVAPAFFRALSAILIAGFGLIYIFEISQWRRLFRRLNVSEVGISAILAWNQPFLLYYSDIESMRAFEADGRMQIGIDRKPDPDAKPLDSRGAQRKKNGVPDILIDAELFGVDVLTLQAAIAKRALAVGEVGQKRHTLRYGRRTD